MPFVVGIEGYFKTGKTTVANILSQKYNIPILEIGVLYRIIASLLLERHLTEEQIKTFVMSQTLQLLMQNLSISYHYEEKSFYPLPSNLTSTSVSQTAAFIGAITGDKWYPNFSFLVEKVAQKTNVILVGRNLLNAYPRLNMHFFLTASFEKQVELTIQENPELSLEAATQVVQKREAQESLIRRFSIQDVRTKVIDVSNKSLDEVIVLISNKMEESALF